MMKIAVVLILLHGPDGHEIRISPSQVTSMRSSVEGQPNKALDDDVRCMINLADGKFVSVVEPCHIVQHMLEEAK
jgi:hypothetical protein